MQVNDNIHAVAIDALNEVSDRVDIVLPAILRLDPVHAQPALLIKGDPHDVSVPILHVLNHVIVIGTVKYPVAIDTLKLGT
jgi:hypothetical protein